MRGIEQFGIVVTLVLAILALAMWLRRALGGSDGAPSFAPVIPPGPQ